MPLTDRSQRSHRSWNASSDSGLTHVTDDPDLASSSPNAPYVALSRPIRGYDPVFAYQQSIGTSFKSAPGDTEETCSRQIPKETTRSASKNIPNNYFQEAPMGQASLETYASRSMGDGGFTRTTLPLAKRTVASYRKTNAASPGLGSKVGKVRFQRRQQTLSEGRKNRKGSLTLPSVLVGSTGSSTLTLTSRSHSQDSGSRSRSRDTDSRSHSASRGSVRKRASKSSTTGRTVAPENQPLIETRLRRRSSLPLDSSLRSTSDQSFTSRSSTAGASSAGSRRTPPSVQPKGLCAKLDHYWTERRRRAQKEFRRKERKRQLPSAASPDKCHVWTPEFIRSLVRGHPLADPTVPGQYGTSGTYRPFGHTSNSQSTDMASATPSVLSRSTPPGDRAPYNKDDYGKHVIVCSQKRAILIMCLVFMGILAIALIAAFARPACMPVTGVIRPTTVAPPVVTPPTTPDGELFPWDDVRLPHHIVPHAYAILIHPNLTTLSVVGKVSIDLSVVEDASFIVLHCRNMSITEKSLRRADNSANISISKMLLYPKRDQMYLGLSEPLRQGQNYSLVLKFSYILKEALEGFYLSHYDSATGAKVRLATTQFEPNAARAAFPCLDEPHMKATFQLSMVRHQSHTALFNAMLRQTEDLGFYLGDGIKQDNFYESVRMSTYLVAFIVSDYRHISDTTSNDVVVSVWAPPHLVQQGQFALEVAVSCLDFYSDYFGIPYQLPKIDLVAIPDFGSGAMENWGLVTFRDTSLLYDAAETSSAFKEWVTLVVAHELAHQWFGNLVTMKWWNDLWLNEGFATLMEFIGAGNAKPDFHMSQQFLLKASMTALSLDSLRNSHPISVPVTDPDEIESIFDVISYSKGAALLYMLMKELGQPVFKAGLHNYLTGHMFANAQTDDLWAAIQQASQAAADSDLEDGEANHQVFDIKAMMDSWTLQKNYPLVTATVSAGRMTLSQSPFLMMVNGSVATTAPEPRWYVPIRCRLDRLSQVLSVRLNKTKTASVAIDSEPGWYYCNVNKTGLYRVTYPAANWAALGDLLLAGSTQLTVQDRGAILDDAFSLNRADSLNATVPLRLSTSLLSERGLVPWVVAYRHLSHWLKLLYDQPTHDELQAFLRRLIGPRYQALGWMDTGSHVTRQRRALVLDWAVSVGLPEAVAHARILFNDWKAGLPVPPDFRKLVYATGVQYGNQTDWQFVWGRYINASTPSEKKSLLWALGSSQDSLTIENFLRRSLAGDEVRTQDFVSVVESMAGNEAARLRLWRFIRLHWPTVLAKFGVGTFMIDNIIQDVVSGFTTQLELDEVRAFFADKELRSADRALRQAIESVQLNIRWRRHHQDSVSRWLRSWTSRRRTAAASA